jgi:hypothetical protein
MWIEQAYASNDAHDEVADSQYYEINQNEEYAQQLCYLQKMSLGRCQYGTKKWWL